MTNKIISTDVAIYFLTVALGLVHWSSVAAQERQISAADLELAQTIEQHRISAIQKVIGSVVAIYGLDRQGGGSGVVVDPSGIAITNHHVIAGAGVRGLGGLNDGQLYPWKLVGTDPGGDVAVIQMSGRESFPCAPLANSDDVKIGDWALAMGNPFLLAEDHTPTVTLGIVSGVKRYQPGAGANQLVYGNCIQVDSSINPGNSGGPLFNLAGEVIGINGRGSFQDRGRVNVGLGYAISSNQVKNFLPELLATKLTEHATLDAGFSDRNGKVVCSQLDRESPIAKLGLRLRDELLEFEGVPITSANQFTNLICTLPEDWPTSLTIRKPDGVEKKLLVRSFGLPYPKRPQTKPLPPPAPPEDGDPGDDKPEPDEVPEDPQQEKRVEELKQEMIKLLSAAPGTIRDHKVSQQYASMIVGRWLKESVIEPEVKDSCLQIKCVLARNGKTVGHQSIWLSPTGRGRLVHQENGDLIEFEFNEAKCRRKSDRDEVLETMSLAEAQLELPVVQSLGIAELIWADAKTVEETLLREVRELQLQAFSSDGTIQLDGAGKAGKKLAWRIRANGEAQSTSFLWFSVNSGRTGLQPQLVKVSIDKDSSSGAVLFHDWLPFEDRELPRQFIYVDGLGESEMLRAKVDSIEWIASAGVDWNSLRGEDD